MILVAWPSSSGTLFVVLYVIMSIFCNCKSNVDFKETICVFFFVYDCE